MGDAKLVDIMIVENSVESVKDGKMLKTTRFHSPKEEENT